MKLKLLQKGKYILNAPLDFNILLSILFLNIFGIIMIFSASYYYAVSNYGFAPTYFMTNQVKYVLIGLVLMLVVSCLKPAFYLKFGILLLLLALLLIVSVCIPGFSHSSHGAARWISIGGITIQVAEPVKVLCIVYLAIFMKKHKITEPKNYLHIFGAYGLIAFLLLWLTNNMSTAIIVFLIMFFTLMISFPRQKWFWILIAAGSTALILGLIYIDRILPYAETENFRITRIRAWLHPEDAQFADDIAYQANQARYAIASGGFFGKGLGQSLIKFKLPEPHNDFILSIILEELGIFGMLVLSFLYIYLLYKVYMVYAESRNRYSKLLVLGIFLHLSIQVLMNYAVNLGFLPTMGVTLPFISAGGASAFFTLAELGLVLAVQRENVLDRVYREAEDEMRKEDPRQGGIYDNWSKRKKEHEQQMEKRKRARRK